MNSYFEAVSAKMKDWKVAVLVIVFTVARIIYGWAWVESGLHKLEWFTNGKPDSAGLIGKMVANIAGENVTRFDPLYLNKLFAGIAQNIFLGMPGLTDALVVIFEIGVGVLMILGFRVFWAALIAFFLNIQFIAAGSFNNFGYIWTNLAFMKVAPYAELLGVDGFLRFRKGKDVLNQGTNKQAVMAK